MDGWMGAKMDGRNYVCTSMYVCMDEWMDGGMDGCIDTWIY
jgi:hypothetical protein